MADDAANAFDSTRDMISGLEDSGNTLVSRSVAIPPVDSSAPPFDMTDGSNSVSDAPPPPSAQQQPASSPDISNDLSSSSANNASSSSNAPDPSSVAAAPPPPTSSQQKSKFTTWILIFVAVGGLLLLGFLVYKLASREQKNMEVTVSPDIHIPNVSCSCTTPPTPPLPQPPVPPNPSPAPGPPGPTPPGPAQPPPPSTAVVVGPPPGYKAVAPPPMKVPGAMNQSSGAECAVANNPLSESDKKKDSPTTSSAAQAVTHAAPSAFSARVPVGKDAPKYVKSGTGFQYSTASAAPLRPSWAPRDQAPQPFIPNTTYAEFSQGAL